MAEARVPNPLVDQFRKGGIPKDLRMMAAQGALPLKPADLVELLHFLLSDKEPDVGEAAAGALGKLPVEEVQPLCTDRLTPAPVLGWLLANRKERELREPILQNTGTADEDIQAVVPALPTELAELVVINQTRLLRSLPLLEAVESNPTLSNDQRRRLRELRETFKIGVVEAPPPPPPPPVEAAPEPAPEPEPEASPASETEAVAMLLSDDEKQDEEKVSAVQKLYRLNTAGKVVAALKGTREERAILVRDPNRIVSSAVLGSPKITEAEIEAFSAMKNISGEILRQIGTNKDFMKRYSIISNLVKNPRTPLAVSIGMVARLNPRDMKAITVDRNVPEVIRKQAQRFVKSAQDGPGGGKH